MSKTFFRILLTAAWCCIPLGVSGQDVDELIREGIRLHGEQRYDEAIGVYRKALEILPDSPVILSEIAMSSLYAGDNEKALIYSDQALRQLGGNFSGVYLTKGSALRNMGRLSEAATVFKQGLTVSGSYFMLHYALGQVLYLQHRDEEAIPEWIAAIRLQPNHGSSHLLLGYTLLDQQKVTAAQLSLLYFLLLEPSTDRSREAFQALWHTLGPPQTLSDYVTGMEQCMEKLLKEELPDTPWTAFQKAFYLPFFRSLHESGFTRAFALYLAAPSSEEATRMLSVEGTTFSAFREFLESYE